MTIDNKWYTPIIYILFLSATSWLIGNVNINTSNERKVTSQTTIIDYPEDSFLTEKQVSDSLPSKNLEKFDSSTVVQTIDNEIIKNETLSVIQEDSLFFDQLMSHVKIYDHPVKKAIIRYYKKEMDKDKVKILQKYGFYIHERPSELKKTYESNALYIGDSISNHDILIVAYSLLKQGVKLKHITESKGHDGWKANAIEVVTDTTVVNNQIISLRYLRDNWGDI